MTNFTTIFNRGKKKYQDKYLKKRTFGKCEGCGNPDLLIQFGDEDVKECFFVCDSCYNKLITHSI